MASKDHSPSDRHDRGDRTAAIATGIFFIIATAFLFLGEAIYKPVLTGPDVLQRIGAARPRVFFGIVVEFLCVLAIPMVAVSIYPVLRRVNESVALAYVVVRTLEAVMIITVAQINRLALIGLSDALAADDAVPVETIMAGYAAQSYWGDTAGPLYNLTFVIGALILYGALFRSRLIPRWISFAGIVAIVMLGGAVMSDAFVPVTGIWVWVLVLPIAVQEMVMALWFILKGFDRRELAALDRP